MSHRSSRWVNLPAAFLLAGCASVGSQPPVYVEDPKPKVQDPCKVHPQTAQDQENCKKSAPK